MTEMSISVSSAGIVGGMSQQVCDVLDGVVLALHEKLAAVGCQHRDENQSGDA